MLKKVPEIDSGAFYTCFPNGRLLSKLGVLVVRSDTGVIGGVFSLSSSSSNTRGVHVYPPISKSLTAPGEKRLSIFGLKAASNSSCRSSQKTALSSDTDTSLPLVSISCASALGRNSSLISNVPCWPGVIGIRAE